MMQHQLLPITVPHRHRCGSLCPTHMISLSHSALVRWGLNQSALVLAYRCCWHAQCLRRGREASLPAPCALDQSPELKVSLLHPNTEIQHHTMTINQNTNSMHITYICHLCLSIYIIQTIMQRHTHLRHTTDTQTDRQHRKARPYNTHNTKTHEQSMTDLVRTWTTQRDTDKTRQQMTKQEI